MPTAGRSILPGRAAPSPSSLDGDGSASFCSQFTVTTPAVRDSGVSGPMLALAAAGALLHLAWPPLTCGSASPSPPTLTSTLINTYSAKGYKTRGAKLCKWEEAAHDLHVELLREPFTMMMRSMLCSRRWSWSWSCSQ